MPKFRGSGGAEWDIDVPAEGSLARERFDAQVEAGQLVPVEEPEKAAPTAKKAATAKKSTED